MQLKEVMKTEVVTVGRNETVTNAAKRMREANIGCLVIVDGDSLVGIVTDRDLLIGCLGAGHDPSACQVSDYMSSPVITESPATEIQVAAHMMVSRKIKRLPLVEDGKLVGLVSFSDLGHSMG